MKGTVWPKMPMKFWFRYTPSTRSCETPRENCISTVSPVAMLSRRAVSSATMTPPSSGAPPLT